MTQEETLCPCGSHNSYAACCGRFIDNHEYPDTAEQLMRSRYCAYTRANIDYIERTMRGPAAIGFNRDEAQQWATGIRWLGLEVLAHKPHPNDPNKAIVKFIASYQINNQRQELQEKSKFEKIDKQWYYIEGT